MTQLQLQGKAPGPPRARFLLQSRGRVFEDGQWRGEAAPTTAEPPPGGHPQRSWHGQGPAVSRCSALLVSKADPGETPRWPNLPVAGEPSLLPAGLPLPSFLFVILLYVSRWEDTKRFLETEGP